MYSVTVTEDKGCQVICNAVVMSSGSSCGEIGDKVWHDIDGDGMQSSGEPGIPNVEVNLYDATTGAFISSQSTNQLGEYCFTGIPQGNYYLE